jgi:hypothetical protein
MKKLLVIIFLLFPLICMAGTLERPKSSGGSDLDNGGTIEGPLTVTGEFTANNIIYSHNHVGGTLVSNIVRYSSDFQRPVWGRARVNIVDYSTHQQLTQIDDSDLPLSVSQELLVDDLTVTMFVKVKSLTNDFTPVSLEFQRWIPIFDKPSKDYFVHSENYQTLRFKSYVGLNNEGTYPEVKLQAGDATLVVINVKDYSVYVSLPTALKSYGDSIAFTATSVTGNIPFRAESYTSLYANRYMIEVENEAVGGDKLDDIISDATGDLGVNKYAITFLEGGVNDIRNITPLPTAESLFAKMQTLITLAKISSPIVVVLNIPDIPDFISGETTVAEDIVFYLPLLMLQMTK